ncbi:hypothetical protein CYMTET_11050 [Cymbomonas tetramitiformis]|uniref:Uncharacterized protein n=1 Tax=Cymbomonas tetramitiformis TaxID=36881 RepID=A0AAE0GMY4_9CHLO|nr:hypothetical protein CYMTET_11050 [Cymbomonas tetramitiformis]
MLMVWGNNDNHIPRDGRRLIYEKMSTAGVNFSWCELNSAHAMMRDHASKERYDAALTGAIMGLVNELFTRRLLLGLIDDGTTSIGARTQKDLGSFTD